MQTAKEVCYNEFKQTVFREKRDEYLHWVMEEYSYTVSSRLADKLDIADLRAAYDENAKMLLAEKVILSHVLGYTVREYSGRKPEEILPLIEGVPQVSQGTGTVLAGLDGHREILPVITGDCVENVIPGEGSITFDIKFHTWISDMPDSEKLLVDVEVQKNYCPRYDIVTRGVFYGARMLSAQCGTEFTHAEYDKLKKVYSIWICTDVPAYAENTVTEYAITPKNLEGSFPTEKGRYDLLSIIVIGLPKNPEKLADKGVPRLLGVLFSMELSVAEKKKILETEYHIPMTREITRRTTIMCNLSEGIWERGIEKGIEQGIQQGIIAMVQICKEFNISREDTLARIKEKFSLSKKEAESQLAKYWMS